MKKYENCNILIQTGVNGNYISHKLVENLSFYQLQDPYQYTNFNGETHEIKETVEIEIELIGNRIPIRLLVENEGFNNTLEIILGTRFLDSISSYNMTTSGIVITPNDKIYMLKENNESIWYLYTHKNTL